MHNRIIIIITLFLLLLSANQVAAQSSEIQGYDRSWEIKPGYFKVRNGRYFGITTKEGAIIVPCEYNQIWDLNENDILKVLKGSKIGLYSINGVEIAPAQYDQIYSFENGRARVLKNGKMGYIDKSGHEIIKPVYDQIWDFKNNRARVLKNGKIGYIDEAGHEVISALYDQIWDFEDERARVLKNGKIGYINPAGHEIIPPQYDQIWDFENKRAKVLKNGKVGYVDPNGREVIPAEYDQIWDFRNERAKVLKNGKIGFIDPAGRQIIQPRFNQIWEFENGKAKALLDGKIVWIDTKGNVIETSDEEAMVPVKEIEVSEVVEENEMNDSIFNDSTVVRIWSDRVEIVTKRSTDTDAKQTYVEYRNVNHKKKRRFQGHWAGMNVGYNNLVTSSGSFSYPDEYMFMEMNAGKSVGVAINPWQQSIKLQRRGNIGLVTGLGVEWNNYRFDSQYILTRDENGNTSYVIVTDPIKKNKLTTIYLNAPLLLEFQVPIGRERYPLYISGGAIGGLRLGSHTRVVTVDGGKLRSKDHFNLTQWRYGATVRMGYRAINLFADYYFSPLFEKDRGPELYQVSAGIFIYLDY